MFEEVQTSKRRSTPPMVANVEEPPVVKRAKANKLQLATVHKEEAPSTTAGAISKVCIHDFVNFLFKFRAKKSNFYVH